MDNSESEEPWNEEETIFSLTENLSNSYVDASKLISYFPIESSVGMENFRQKKNPTTPIVPPHLTKSVISPARLRWKRAAHQVRQIHDPWAEFKIDLTCGPETCRDK